MNIFQETYWLPLIIVIPFITAIFCLLTYKKLLIPSFIFFFIMEFFALASLTLQIIVKKEILYPVGGWDAPLGIVLSAGSLSVIMLILTYILKVLLTVYTIGYFTKQNKYSERFFWVLWFFLFGSLNVLFLSNDIFNIYVALELIGLSSVALIASANSEAALLAALRYLFVTISGSLFYLLGVAIIYLNVGALDIKIVAENLHHSTSVTVALIMILGGLILKTALFPLHFWLPPAHSNALSPVSAILSALVIKATFFLIMRYLFEIMPDSYLILSSDGLLFLGSLAVIYGSVMAYRSERLKLLIAYSTVAQIGYLFLIFSICTENLHLGFTAGIYQLISHAFAKTLFFLAAGNMIYLIDNDNIENLKEILTSSPATFFSLAVAGISLIGIPPSGGFIAKWLLLQGAIATGNWFIVMVICTGSLLAAAYMFKVLKQAFTSEAVENNLKSLPKSMEIPVIILALIIISLGFLSYYPLLFIEQQINLMGVV